MVRAAAFVLACAGLTAACGQTSGGPTDAAPDVTAADAVVDVALTDRSNPFAFDAPSCGSPTPGMPCSMTNMICPAVAACEFCQDGYVHRRAECVCGGGFWNCDECASCGACDAGTIYMDPACTRPVPAPRDAAADSLPARDT